ncbi:Acetolactate synthase large subunit [Labilithrix luteola]|uniref:Acetolactate synthase n=1 Tax=Labilithrix luteola TaxID=1391654 RepID=A0A0K1PWE7_9BACT|nr:acetolactate synthase 2 catalytic subunit [Labilithrix luteola]AKU97842.1 Acetolactate synthase large subunit [Labilithrix luteola]
MNAADLLVRALEHQGVDVLFGYPGGAILPFYDALVGSRLRHILVRHEQAAALAADGYARATGRVGVCVATSGPGATNLVTGLANAALDSVPVVAVTGQVPTTVLGTDAFQEVDIFGLTMPIVKHSFLVRNVADLPAVVAEAFRIAKSGRPGPVLIDVPKDVANTDASGLEPLGPIRAAVPPSPNHAALERAGELLRKAERPIAYVGGGVAMAGAIEELRAFIAATGIPVVTTLKGIGAVDGSEPLLLGMLGMHGSRAANLAVQRSDLLVCLGARFDDRATGKLDGFAPNARVIHADVDAAEIDKLRRSDVALVGDLRVALRGLNASCARADWRATCLADKEREPMPESSNVAVDGPRFLRKLSELLDERTIVTCDVGQHQMWVAQHVSFRRPELHLSSGGLGSMGYGLPAAIGAQLGRPDARVIAVSGDGSFLMNVQELATIKRYSLPVKIVLFDNQALGLVRQWQELFHAERYSEIDLSDNPDFVRVAEAFGMPAIRVDHDEQVPQAIRRVLDEPGPLLAHVILDHRTMCWPLVPPNKTNAEMLNGEGR